MWVYVDVQVTEEKTASVTLLKIQFVSTFASTSDMALPRVGHNIGSSRICLLQGDAHVRVSIRPLFSKKYALKLTTPYSFKP